MNNRGLTYYYKLDYQQAMNDFALALEYNPQFALALTNRATTYIALGEYEQAVEDCNRALQINAQFVNAYFIRGVTYVMQERWAQARRDWEKAVELDPNGPAGQHARANLERLRQMERVRSHN